MHFKAWLFKFSVPQGKESVSRSLSDIPPLYVLLFWRWVSISLSLLLFSFLKSFYSLLCRSYISPHFFLRMNCSMCRCKFSVSVGGVGLKLPLYCHPEVPVYKL